MSDHIQDGELLRVSDDELSKDRAAQINEHLAACWMCRTRKHDLDGAIDNFVHIYTDEFKLVIPAIDGPRALLRARIAALEADEQRNWWKNFWYSSRWSKSPVYAAVAAVVIAAIALSLFMSLGRRNVTAAEVLSRAEAHERNELERTKQPVTYQKIRIVVAGHGYDRMIYMDKKASRYVAHVESVAGSSESEKDTARVLEPVERAFAESKLDWQEPLSPSRLGGWRAALHVRADRVLRDRAITEIATNTPEGPIAEARITFRNVDFHPISETLRLRDNSVVEIAELDYRVFELSQMRADLFDRWPPSMAPLGSVPLGIPKISRSEPVVAGGLELELDVVERLDRAKGFLGEQISVERQQNRVALHGVVDDEQRKKEIIMALGSAVANPALKVDIVVPEAQHAGYKSNSQVSVEGVESLQKAPADDTLRAFFGRKSEKDVGTDQAVQRFASEISTHSQSARAHALALKQIAEQFSLGELSQMTPEQHAQWHALLRLHAQSVLMETRLMRENLEPIFRTSAEDKQPLVPNVKTDADLIYAATRLSKLTASSDGAVWHSFAASTQASNVTLVCLPEFWDSLLDAELLAQQMLVSTSEGN
jgi:hypothetical protein